ncbi:hypothetical protein GCM10027052_08900 [Parafrigoribacterium mesophilum]|uniref:hypothetical protein n=1 Tax=Parafrigoribacterium mesophilum TaxID=433646 RepID=UPI0031FE0114
MKTEVVHIEDCPNWEEAGRRLRVALDTVGAREVTVGYRLLTTSDEAAAVWFAGSPTILIDGADAFPTGGRTTDIACRVYYTDGRISRLPTVEQLVQAVEKHR